jgi:hypothetical protein
MQQSPILFRLKKLLREALFASRKKHSSGAKARVYSLALTARLKRLRKKACFQRRFPKSIPQRLKPALT